MPSDWLSKSSSSLHDQKGVHTTTISAGVAFFIWLIVLIIIIWILRAIGIAWFSTIVFSFIVATFILTLFFPLQFVDGRYMHKSEDAIFGLIHLITWILVIIYIIWKVFSDRAPSHNGWWGMGNGSGAAKYGAPPGNGGQMMAKSGELF